MRLAPFKSFGRLYILIYFLIFLQPVYSQSELPFDEDPYLDPDGVESVNKKQRFKDDQGFLIGFLYVHLYICICILYCVASLVL